MELSSWSERRRHLILLQKYLRESFDEENYNVFVFGSFIRSDFNPGVSDIDLVVYCPDFRKRDEIASFLKNYFDSVPMKSDVLQYFYSPNATIFYPAIMGGMGLTDYFPKELKSELFYLRRYFEKEQREKREYARYMRWYSILLGSGRISNSR